MNGSDKNIKFPLENYDRLCFLKNVVKNPNIIVGDYTTMTILKMLKTLRKM